MIEYKKKFLFKKKTFNFYKTFITKFFSYCFILQLIILFFISIFYFSSNFSKVYPIDFLLRVFNQKQKIATGIDFTQIPLYISYTVKGAYFSIIGPDTENLNISVNQKNVIFLDAQRKKKLGSKDYTNIDLSKKINGNMNFNDEKFKIKLRVKGDRKMHFKKSSETSYRVDIRGQKRIFGMEEFSIQKPITRNYVYELMFHRLNEFIGNLNLNYQLISLYFNGENRGIFAIEEGISKELLERSSKRDGPIYSLNETQGTWYPNVQYKAFSEDYWIQNNVEILRSGYSILNKVKSGLVEVDDRNFDLDSWAKYFASVDLIGAHHGSLSKSVRLYFNPTTGKIEPVPFDGHIGTGSIDLKYFIILDLLDDNPRCSYICEDKKWLLKFLIKNNGDPNIDFIEKYINYLKLFSKKKFIDEFLNKYNDEIYKFNKAVYSEFSRSDQVYGKGLRMYIYDKNLLYERAELIKDKLRKKYLNKYSFSLDKNNLHIVSTTSYPIKISSECKKLEKKAVNTFGNNIIKWKKSCENIKIESLFGEKKQLVLFSNPSLEINKNTNSYYNYSMIEDILEGKTENNIFYPLNDKILISSNIYIPKNKTVIFSEGQEINFKRNNMIFSEGNLIFNGLKNNPIIINGLEANTIISSGGVFNAKNLIVDNLSQPYLSDRIFYGGINIINSKANLENITINNFKSEDAINFINSETKVKNINLYNINSDAIDVDFGTFIFSNINCKKIVNDCLDISGAKITGNNLRGIDIGDKLISVGEKSFANIDTIQSEGAKVGLVSKDQSTLIATKVKIINTKMPIAVFVKKYEFGPANLNVKNITLIDSPSNFLVDENSRLFVDDQEYHNKTKNSEIKKLIY